jgi:ABC-type phosphate transport system substrate-binding protein
MKSKMLAGILALTMSAALLGGCGGGSSNSGSDQSEQSSQAATDSGEKETITVAASATPHADP